MRLNVLWITLMSSLCFGKKENASSDGIRNLDWCSHTSINDTRRLEVEDRRMLCFHA